jgi:hypothetical protein
MLADKLHKSVEEIMGLSSLELDLWAAWIKIQQDASNEQLRKQRAESRRRR